MNDIEYSEVVIAGKRALEALKNAKGFLGNAKNWGVVDSLGGGLLSGWMKYGDIKYCKKQIERAERELQTFSNMLGRLNISDELDTIDGLIKIVDLLRDNFLVDFIVQGHIKEAMARLDDAISLTERTLSDLLREDTINYFKHND